MSLHFDITGDNSNFLRKLDEARNGVRSTSKQIEESGMSIEQTFGRMAKGAAALGAGFSAQQFVSQVMKVRGEFQQLEVAFNTMLGGEQKATSLMQQLVKTAATTPFDLQSVANGAKQLLAYGTAAEDVNGTLIRLGDIAAGLSIPLGDLVYLYGTTMSQGRLYAQDLNQFTGRGIPMIGELAKQFGVAESEVKKLVESGRVGFPEVQKVIESLTNEGGKFGGLMAAQSKTITGQISNIEDSISTMYNNIGKQSEGFINDALSGVSYLIENYEQIGKAIIELTATYGAYKAVLIAITAIQKLNSMILRQAVVEKRLATAAGIALSNAEAIASAQTKIFTIAQTNLTKAIKATTAAMLTNPYILAAAAVAGLGYGIYKLITYQTDAQKAQLKLNNAIKECEKDSLSEQRELVKLKGELSGLTKGTDEYNTVKDKIVKGFGKYYSGLDGEIEKVGLTEQAYNKLAEAINRSFGARQYEKFASEQQDELSNTMAENFGKIQDRLYKDLGEEEGARVYVKIRQSLLERKELDKDITKIIDKAQDKGTFLADSRIDGYIENIRSAQTITDNLDKKARTRFGIDDNSGKKKDSSINQKEEEKKAASEWLSSYKKKYDDAEKAYNDFLKSKQVMSDADRDKELERLKGLRDTAKATYESKGGSVSSDKKGESAAEKLRKKQESLREQQEKYNLLMDKQKLDRQRQSEDLESQAAQAEIDALSDGFDKKEKQRDLNNKKEIQALERQKEDYIRTIIQAEKEKFDTQEDINKTNDPKHVKKTFDASTVKVDTSKYDKIIENTKTSQGLNEWEQREASMNEYLIKYGTFSQKKEAIDKKYREAIDQEVDLGKKNTLQKEWKEATANLDLSKLKQEINWEMIFGDLSKVTKDQLIKIKTQLQEFKKSPEFQNATPEQIQVIEGAINSINNAMVDKGGFFGGMVDSVRELKIATEELQKAEEELAKANKNGTEAQKEEAQKKVNKAKNRQQNAETNVTKSSDKTIDHLTSVSNAIAQLGSSAEMSLSSFGNAAGSIVDAFTEAGSKVGGIVGAIFSILDGIQQQGFDKFIGNILESVAGAALSAATFGLVKTGADYSRYNEMKDQYEALNDIWDEIIDKKKEYIEISYGIEASKAGEEAKQLQQKAIDSYRTLGRERLNSGASAGSHSIGVRINKGMSSEGWDEAKKALGEDFNKATEGRMTGLFDLSSKQLEKLKEEAPTFWAKLDGDVRDYLNNIIEGEEKIEEIQDKVKEQLTQTSFDNVFDSFMDTLMDMDSAAQDFADDFEEYLRRAVITNMMSPEIQEKLKKWYEDFAEAMDEGTIADKQPELRAGWDKIVEDGIAKRDELFKTMGWSSNSSYSEESSKRNFASMSQDTGDELNGRFTALYISNEEIKNSMLSMLSGVNLISTTTTANGITLMEIRNLAISSNSYLEDIAKYTKPLLEVGGKLDRIESNTKGLKSK